MTVIVCKINKDGYEIASDSITIRDWTQSKSNNTTFSKLFEINNLVIGSTGTMMEVSLFKLFCITHRPSTANETAILEFLSEFSEWKNKKIGEKGIENSYFLGIDGSVFGIEEWLVEEIITYSAIGAGMDFALSALYLGHSVDKAVQTAIELSIYCEGPIQVIKK